MFRGMKGWAVAVWLLGWLASGQAQALEGPAFLGERLHYRLAYRGVLSPLGWTEVGDVVLRTAPRALPLGGREAYESSLFATTEHHAWVESLYPFRYRLRTLFALSPDGSLAFERFKQDRRLKHELVWVDRQKGRIQRYSLESGGEGPAPARVPEPLAAWARPGERYRLDSARPLAAAEQAEGALDRLGLLQVLRQRLPAEGERLSLPVTDGRKRFLYRIRNQGRERLEAAGREWPTWRLRVEKVRLLEGGAERPDGEPATLWVGTGPRHVPVRLEEQIALGRVTMELVAAGTPPRLSAPRQPSLLDWDG